MDLKKPSIDFPAKTDPSIRATRLFNYATTGPLGALASGPHCCPRCGCPCRDRKDYQRHRKTYHAKDVKHGVSYNGMTGTWRVQINGGNTYLLSEEEAWAHWKENR